MKRYLSSGLIVFALITSHYITAQRTESEIISVKMLREPVFLTDSQNRNYTVIVNSPYNITKDDVIKNAKDNFQAKLDKYNADNETAKQDFQERLRDYDQEVKKMTEKYRTESEQFNKLSTIEKLAVTTGPPVLRLPSRPELHLPPAPREKPADLANALIVDNKVLESQINIDGFSKSGNYLEVLIDLQRTRFQDNAGNTFANQPTRITVKQNGTTKLDKSYFTEFEQVASSASNEIDQNAHENQYLKKVLSKINSVLNDNFGYQSKLSSVKIETVKNKGDYDDLEKASIYVTTNLKKLQARPDYEPNKAAMENMQKGINIWKDTLTKINYKDKKALLNEKIANYVYFNLIRVSLALGNKKEAENYLNDMQEHIIDIKLSYDEEKELKDLEKAIYE